MFNKRAKRPTKAEAARMSRLKEMPCIACWIYPARQPYPTEVHHLIYGNKRRGHAHTIPLCWFHHRAVSHVPYAEMELLHGPSLAKSSRRFHLIFGSDSILLERTNKLLEKHSEAHC